MATLSYIHSVWRS